MKTVLVATDGSEGANRALDYAVQLTKREAADLLIVNVIGGYQGPGGLFRHLSDERQAWLREELKSASATLLQQARERALSRGLGAAHIESCEGEVAQSIVETAKSHDAVDIVVGRRGFGRAAGLLLGSVSQKVVTIADRPVTVVP